MKKLLMFFAAALTISVYAAPPTTAPVAPTQDAKDVKALFCSAYTDLGFEPTSWGTTWQTINVQGTSMFYTESMGWDCFTNWGAEEYDLSGYSHFCIDLYATAAGRVNLTFESTQGPGQKVSRTVNFMAGWNKIDLDVKDSYPGVTFQHIKYLTLEAFSDVGSEFAVANAYFYRPSAPTEDPIVANDYYVHVVYAEESETKVLNANTKYLERIKNVTEDEANSLLLIFREGTESVHAGDTITIAEAEIDSILMKKGEDLMPAATTGTAKRTGNVDVNWVQLWENGPKFAEYNVGAANNKAEDYGGYYAWGGHQDKVDDHKSGSDPLSGNDDTATNLWGNNWRMPTKAELDDLLANCDVEWTVVNGVNGRKFTGKGDYASNSVFFPAAGRCNEGSVIGQDYYGFYWSSTPNGSLSAYNLLFSSGVQSVNNDGRSLGYSVRAVLVEK